MSGQRDAGDRARSRWAKGQSAADSQGRVRDEGERRSKSERRELAVHDDGDDEIERRLTGQADGRDEDERMEGGREQDGDDCGYLVFVSLFGPPASPGPPR